MGKAKTYNWLGDSAKQLQRRKARREMKRARKQGGRRHFRKGVNDEPPNNGNPGTTAGQSGAGEPAHEAGRSRGRGFMVQEMRQTFLRGSEYEKV